MPCAPTGNWTHSLFLVYKTKFQPAQPPGQGTAMIFLGNNTKDTLANEALTVDITWELIPMNLRSFKKDLDPKEKQKVIMWFQEKFSFSNFFTFFTAAILQYDNPWESH